ncbi:MAG: DUF1289 domain-containing protein [Pseudomonadota bacterium]
MTITSPCTGICKLDEPTGWCIGCGRSGDEIAVWRGLPEDARDDVWAKIPERLGELGVACRRLPWTTEDIREFVIRSCENARGTWVIGVVGAVAEFMVPEGASVEVRAEGDAVIAHTRNGALRMVINDDLRALTFDPPNMMSEPRVVLAVKRGRGGLPVANGVADLGPDHDALIEHDGNRLFDLGLARSEGRFGVRVADGPAQTALQGAVGLPLSHALTQCAGPLFAESPTRVVESALGRIEVQGRIPMGSAPGEPGPHTHLLPDQLATSRALPVGMDLPRAYLPGAVFYPKS